MRLGSSPLVALGIVLAASGALPPPQDRVDAQPPLSRAAFAGHTLSAVTYARGSGGASVAATMWQAYLHADGQATIRSWDGARNAYSPAQRATWTLEGERFCLGRSPQGAAGPVCVDLHGWGTTLAGIGADGRSMFKGDLKPGDLVSDGRR